MTQIFIENNPLDITADISALLTFAIDDIKDFASRNTTFSKTIVLPGTARNNKAFGHVFDVRNANPYDSDFPNVNINFNPAKKARCIIFQNQIQTFKGDLRLLEIVIDKGSIEYEVAVFGELYGLINNIGGGRLEDLDFSAYDHVYNWTNINASWANANGGAGYYYPLIDYGGYSAAKANWAVGTFRPAFFAKQYLEKIFAAAGYTYTFALASTDRFKRLIIPHNQNQLRSSTTILLNATQSATVSVLNNAPDSARLPFDAFTGTLFTGDGGETKFTYVGTDPLSLTVSLNLAYEWRNSGATQAIELKKNGVTLATKTLSNTGGVLVTSGTWVEDVAISLVTTDFIELWVTVSNSSLTPYTFNIKACSFTVNSLYAIPVPVVIGDTILSNDTIPKNILQKDFFTSIIQLFNLYVYEDSGKDKHLNITPYIDFYVGAEIDWTDKIDRSLPIKITPMSQVNVRFYDFKFKNDADYYNDLYQKRYNEGYGQYIYDSAFDFESERKKVELVFSPTVLVGYAGEDKVMSTILKIENNIESSVDSNIRLLQAATVTGVTSWNLLTLASGLTEYPYAGHYDNPDAPSNDIQFGVPKELFFTVVAGDVSSQQFNLYWSEYMAEITDKDSKLLTATIKLDIVDILNIDFGALIWVDGALWRLNKIEDYNMSEPDLCKVSLLKVIEKEY